ncbi:hypothetical protein BV911_14090 [Pseudoruegeria sp. SK021]|nr:hypothetical protein BV911_14090 [Pseudoruegeria sp. SK021]
MQHPYRLTAILAVAVLALGACATTSPEGAEFNDPYEPVNRSIHGLNKGLDTVVFRPASAVYGTVVPGPVRDKVTNFSYNLELPGQVINNVLQGRIDNSVHNTFRFMLNSTLGVLGLFDPATSFGLERRKTDFGETLHVWGAGEGAYVAVPVFGPSTQRDFAGDVVDYVLNPVSLVLVPPESYATAAAWVGENASYRYDFSDTVDALLYESADSYAQARLIYLQNRRYELGDDGGDTYIDPYEDLYSE